MNPETNTDRSAFVLNRLNSGTAPSLRVPVTARNRALLRRLRAAELTAWQEADHSPRRLMRLRPTF